MSTPLPAPFVLSTHGRAEIPHPAERAVINVAVASQGLNKAAVSDEVVTTAQHIERLLRELSPQDETSEAKEAAPLAHWSKTGLSATSRVPCTYDKEGNKHEKPRQFNARITFDVRFKKFKEMGAFGTKLSALPHAEVNNIDWILTTPTSDKYQSQLRKDATKDALQKAQDYCNVLGCGNPRPVELNEGDVSTGTGGSFGRGGTRHVMAQCAPGYGPNEEHGSRDESPLEFTPKEVKMGFDVTVKWHADPACKPSSPRGSTLAKRPRIDNEMEE